MSILNPWASGQRWRDGDDSFRPEDDERFDPGQYEVVLVEDESQIRPFVSQHHYSCSMPNSGRFRFLLIHAGRPSWAGPDGVCGAALFGVPSGPKVLQAAFPFLSTPKLEAVELQRLVLLDEVRRNGESWFVAQAMRRHAQAIARQGVEAVVSFSDPVPRYDGEGNCTKPGHQGIVYQALNAWHTGRSKARWTWYRDSDGYQINERDLTKIRAACPCCGTGRSTSGGRGAVERLVEWGACAPEAGECWRTWLQAELPQIATRRRHGGNHRFLFGLNRATKRGLRQLHGDVDPGRYPKEADAA